MPSSALKTDKQKAIVCALQMRPSMYRARAKPTHTYTMHISILWGHGLWCSTTRDRIYSNLRLAAGSYIVLHFTRCLTQNLQWKKHTHTQSGAISFYHRPS